MPNFTTKDVYAITNAVVEQLTGQDNLTVFDTDSFVSAGDVIMSYSRENVLDALSTVLGRTFMAVRPYKAKLSLITEEDSTLYGNRIRKISYYTNKAVPSGWFNTDLYTNIGVPGYDNGYNGAADATTGRTPSTGSMFEQHPPIPFEYNFEGLSTLQFAITVYENQLKIAFRSEEEFAEFVSGIMTQWANDIELAKEAHSRMALLNRMGLSLAMADASSNIKGLKTAIDLKAAFNSFYGTSYTTAELLSTYLKEFLAFFVSEFKDLSDLMTHPSIAYHAAPVKTMADGDHVILRHSPKDRQRLIMYNPFWKKAKALVMPEIFNTEYLDMDTQFEAVDFWQSYNNRSAIDVNVKVPGWLESLITNGSTTADTTYEAQAPYVLGMLFDVDSVVTSYNFEESNTSPLEARKGYRTIWATMARHAITDPTENAVVFYLSADT